MLLPERKTAPSDGDAAPSMQTLKQLFRPSRCNRNYSNILTPPATPGPGRRFLHGCSSNRPRRHRAGISRYHALRLSTHAKQKASES